MKTLVQLRRKMEPALSRMRNQIAAGARSDVTVVCIPRHGFGTTKINVESLFENSQCHFKTIYVDINSPPNVRSYLEQQVRNRNEFTHLRIDEFVSRQTARLLALELVDTTFVIFLDNNMLLSRDCLDRLVATARETGAAMVSPVIVTQGGDIHFSAGRIELREDGIVRPHYQPGGKTRTKLADARLDRVDIDFAESHCCLARTEAIRIPGVLKERLHNAQTLCCAGYTLCRTHDRRLLIEPTSVVSIVPIGFGYDLPWMCRSYMNSNLIRDSYRELISLMGPGPSNDLDRAQVWHEKHFKYLLASMADEGRLTRTDLLDAKEIPENIEGYDYPLPESADEAIRQWVIPYVDDVYPELRSDLDPWVR